MDFYTTAKDYVVTEERRKYVLDIDIQKLKEKLPRGYSNLIREKLLEIGIKYDIRYIKNCLNHSNPQINHYVINAAISLKVDADNPFEVEGFDKHYDNLKKATIDHQ